MSTVEIIHRINEGDATILDNVSRWDIDALYKAGKLKDAPQNLKPAILSIVDSCKDSR